MLRSASLHIQAAIAAQLTLCYSVYQNRRFLLFFFMMVVLADIEITESTTQFKYTPYTMYTLNEVHSVAIISHAHAGYAYELRLLAGR